MRWAIVGPGGIARRRVAPAIMADPHSELVAVASRSYERAKEFAELFGIARCYTSLHSMLRDDAIDIVAVLTPNSLHAHQVVAVAKAGKHVFCDKPLATTLIDAKRAVGACNKNNVSLGMNFEFRNLASFQFMKEVILSGRLGDIRAIRVEASNGVHELDGWRADRSLAGWGVTASIGAHLFDLVRFLLDSELEEVAALFDTGGGIVETLETSAMVVMRMRSNVLASVFTSSAIPVPVNDVVIHGSRGRLEAAGIGHPGYFMTRTKNRVATVTMVSADERRVSKEFEVSGGFERTVTNFRAAIEAGRDPSPSGVDGLRGVEVMEAVLAAASRGTCIGRGTE